MSLISPCITATYITAIGKRKSQPYSQRDLYALTPYVHIQSIDLPVYTESVASLDEPTVVLRIHHYLRYWMSLDQALDLGATFHVPSY